MTLVYNPNDVVVIQRNSTSSSFVEHVLTSQPNSLFFFDSTSVVTTLSTASLISDESSYSISSSWASQSLSSSYSLTSSYLNPSANIYLSQSYIYSDINASPPTSIEGQIWWDKNNHTYTIDTDVSRLQIGQENYIRVEAGEYIPDGNVVYISGSNVNGVSIAYLAIADGTEKKSNIVGVSTQLLTIGQTGFITTDGIVNDIDTSLFTAGDVIYLSDIISGSYTSTMPDSPHEQIIVGTITNSHPTTGKILVNVNYHPLNYSYVGMVSVPTITTESTSSSGSIFTVGTGSVNLCISSNGIGPIKNYTLQSASFIITSSFIDSHYIVATYNSGIPIYRLDSDKNLDDGIQTTTVFTVLNGYNNVFVYSDWDTPGILLANKDYSRIKSLRGVEREDGCILGTTSSINSGYYTISAGHAWQGVTKMTLPAVNSSASRFVLVAHSASIWSGSFVNEIIYDKYDNGINLANLPGGDFVVNWVYRTDVNTNATLIILSNRFGTANLAIESQQPTLPVEMSSYAFLVGRIIAKNATSVENRIYQVDSAYVQTFLPAGITDHNSLSNLQGGNLTLNEYYHLTSVQHIGLTAYKTITGSYVASNLDSVIYASASNANIILTLPVASTVGGQFYRIKKIDSSGYEVIISSSVNIDYSPELILSQRGSSVTLHSNDTQYWIH